MSTIDLFILGFLKKRSWSAYELALAIQENDIDRMIKVSQPAIYKNIRKLAEKSYLSTETHKEGNRPEKVIYSITRKGENYLFELLSTISQQPIDIYLDLNCVLINLDSVSPQEGFVLIENIKKSLLQKKVLFELAEQEHASFPWIIKSIIHQQATLNDQLISWLADFENQYRTSGKN